MVTATKTAPAVSKKVEASPAPAGKSSQGFSRRRKKMRRAATTWTVVCTLSVLLPLGYIGLYAQVTTYGYRSAELKDHIHHVEMRNQDLRAEIQWLSSPTRIAAVAADAGMENGSKPSTVVIGSDTVKVARAD
jgi:cell division protein FtsL